MAKLSPKQRSVIVSMLKEGVDKKAIATSVGVTPAQVAAVAAHVTMKTYSTKDLYASEQKESERLSEVPGIHSIEVEIPLGVEPEGGVTLGWQPTPGGGTPNPHLLILGESGSGKTYATQCICAELAVRNVPTIVFDFGQGFTLDSAPDEFVRAAKPIEIDASREGVNINPLQIFRSDVHGPLNVAQRVADTFARVYSNIGVQQHAVLRDAVLYTFIKAGIDPDDRTTWDLPPPNFGALKDSLDDLATSGMSSARRYASSVGSHISTVFVFNTFRNSGLNLDWRGMLDQRDRVYIVQLRGLEHSLERVVTELLLWNLLGFLESLGPGPLRCMVLLDEAHRMSFAAQSPVEKFLREGRKFGVGLILASQQPEDFSSVAFANTATKLLFNVSDEKGAVSRLLARRSENGMDLGRLLRQISSLRRGHALLIAHAYAGFVRVSSFAERVEKWQLANQH